MIDIVVYVTYQDFHDKEIAPPNEIFSCMLAVRVKIWWKNKYGKLC